MQWLTINTTSFDLTDEVSASSTLVKLTSCTFVALSFDLLALPDRQVKLTGAHALGGDSLIDDEECAETWITEQSEFVTLM